MIGNGTEFRLVQWLGLAGDYLWAAGIVALALILLLFPDGRVPSPRWRWIVRAIGLSFGALVMLGWMGGGVSGTVPVPYPLGLFAPETIPDRIFTLLFDGVMVVALLLGLGAGVVSVVVRFRRSHGVERQQIKWMMFAGLLFVPSIYWDAPGIWDAVLETIVTGSVPVAIALAVTKHRLYEIDRILSRTVAYGLVIGFLAAVYFAGIFLMQELPPSAE